MEFAFNPVRQEFSNGINRPKRTDNSYDPLCISPLLRGRRGGGGRSFLIPAKEMAYA